MADKYGPSSSAAMLTEAEAAEVVSLVSRRFSTAPSGTLAVNGKLGGEPPSDEVAVGGALPYKWFKRRHPEYDARHWRNLDALYAGGKRLLGDQNILGDIFPPHRQELPTVYQERVRTAHYVPYAGEIIDHIVAALGAEQVEMVQGEAKDDGTRDPLPDFYAELHRDCSAPGGRPCSLQQMLLQQILVALKKRRAWTLVELPQMTDELGQEVAFADYGEQEAAGGLDAYFCPLEPECVVDWEEDDDGGLYWAMTMIETCRRMSLGEDRSRVTKRYVHYTPDAWRIFEVSHERGKEPEDLDPVTLVAEGYHTFGRVPLSKLEVPPGLWAMEKLESMSVAHLNHSSALGWAMRQSLFQELYEFHAADGAPGVPPELADDAGRSTNQRRGQGHVQVRPAGDDARFVGPTSDPFAFAKEFIDGLRDEMHRVTHRMSLSHDNSAAALGRSGESKDEDKSDDQIVLEALGKLVREHAEDCFRLASLGRGEDEMAEEWQAQGMEEFESQASGATIEQAVLVESLAIPSPTFKKRASMAVVKAFLPDLPPDDVDSIEDELDQNIADEMFDPALQVQAAGGPPVPGSPAEAEMNAAADDDDEEEDEEVPPPGPRRMGGSPKPKRR